MWLWSRVFGPYAYNRTVRPYAYGRTVWVYAYGPVRADHTCCWIIWVKFKQTLSQSLFLVLQIDIICIIVPNPSLVLSPTVTLATTSNVISEFLATLVTFCCCFFYGCVVVSLTHSPFPFSILLIFFLTFTCLQIMHVPLNLHFFCKVAKY